MSAMTTANAIVVCTEEAVLGGGETVAVGVGVGPAGLS